MNNSFSFVLKSLFHSLSLSTGGGAEEEPRRACPSYPRRSRGGGSERTNGKVERRRDGGKRLYIYIYLYIHPLWSPSLSCPPVLCPPCPVFCPLRETQVFLDASLLMSTLLAQPKTEVRQIRSNFGSSQLEVLCCKPLGISSKDGWPFWRLAVVNATCRLR